ncbi:hypothetical protein VHEMI02856 [[Torrubiella] hemipterigena]|uniref:Uncharacterized protein n=1 Tax=[Torrubiella] hemipterigena TaxID=1531966 RepID=A0A0A1TBQ1_9HYPO|nr:hypothetical protein VHEMI02856 [[Torrubiella] hemipterigena]
MSQSTKSNGLLDLPWEIRRDILTRALRPINTKNNNTSSLPSLSKESFQRRVRLRNCFDTDFPEETNLYVPRNNNRYAQATGLRAVNRQLREETDLLINKLDLPFVMDIMVVKDVGIFPTWLSYPYPPRHLKKLTINLRTIQPGKCAIPTDWVEAGRHKQAKWEFWRKGPTIWNIMAAITLYTFNCLSIKSTASESTRPNALSGLTNVADAHLSSSRAFVTDKLCIHIAPLEYDAKNAPIPIETQDLCKESRLYREGYFQFGRELFEDFSTETMWPDEIDYMRRLLARGEYPCYQLSDRLGNIIYEVDRNTDSAYYFYLRLLARSVGELIIDGGIPGQDLTIYRHPAFWVHLRYAIDCELLVEGNFNKKQVLRSLKKEMKDGWSEMAANLRTIEIRRSHGWVQEDD